MKFLPITPTDFKRLHPYFEKQPYELCEYSLRAIIAWQNEDYRPLCCQNENTLIIRAEFNNGKYPQHLLLPISQKKVFTPLELQDLALDLGVDHYEFVPEQYIHQFGRRQVASYFHIKEQAGHADYIYSTRDIAELKGNKYSKKRNLINQFERKYVSKGRVELASITLKEKDACVDFLEKWCEANDCAPDHQEDLDCEKEALINTFENMEALEIKGLVLRIDGEVCAFGTGAKLTQDMGVFHFEKAYANIKGLYQYFDNQCVKHLFKDYEFVNKENDMGNPGLSKAKKSYYPVKVVKSYQLTVR